MESAPEPAPVHIFRLPETLETEDLPEFQTAVQNVLDAGKSRIAVDASKVVALHDNGWFGCLIYSLKAAREDGGDLRLYAPSHEVTRLLELFGLENAFLVFDTEEEAVASFGE